MNYKLLWIPTTLFASAFTFAVACQPCEDDECGISDGGGEGGSGTGGASGGSPSTGGASTGGAPAAGGAGGLGGLGGGTAEALDCLETGVPSGTPGSCEPTVGEDSESYACQTCVESLCCAEAKACAATNPYTACYYGSTARLGFDDQPITGELDCILDCLRNIPVDEFLGDQDQVDACALECGSAECDESEAGPASVALASCMLGIDNDAYPAGCQEECAIAPTDP